VEDRTSGEWVIEVNEKDTRFRTTEEVISHLGKLEATPTGKASLLLDLGPVSGWKRFLGAPKRDVSPCCAVEWDGPYGSLIFHDDAWSEYRVIDEARPVQATEDQRRRIAHGEPTPHPVEECMEKARAFAAIREYLGSRTRPSWLKYKYVP
jgi:hypothetical protein